MKTRWRRAVRLGDPASSHTAEKLDALVAYHNIWLAAAGQPEANASDRADLSPCVTSFWPLLGKAGDFAAANLIIAVFCSRAHGSCFDVDHGIIHLSPAVISQLGRRNGVIGPTDIGFAQDFAYTTRVSSGPFPTEDFKHGVRWGTTRIWYGTGRKRRCGWFDAVMECRACCRYQWYGFESLMCLMDLTR